MSPLAAARARSPHFLTTRWCLCDDMQSVPTCCCDAAIDKFCTRFAAPLPHNWPPQGAAAWSCCALGPFAASRRQLLRRAGFFGARPAPQYAGPMRLAFHEKSQYCRYHPAAQPCLSPAFFMGFLVQYVGCCPIATCRFCLFSRHVSRRRSLHANSRSTCASASECVRNVGTLHNAGN